ncbi:SNW/SKI-interacting protein [Hibiscus syriacus]|uniref:SNW/SKI-interacting protein n=1 Tax=Hibiscus syriacus TaxID=106335 RepID=A0A6A2WGT0_HIBSY|nr:SNW/SKI-interacting protein [Hibiscus syriacus]
MDLFLEKLKTLEMEVLSLRFILPLDMGRAKGAKPGQKILPVTVDAHGNLAYDAIVRQNENAKKIVYSQHKDLIPKILRNEEEGGDEGVEEEEMQKEIEETMQETVAALEKIVNVRLSAAQPKNVPKQSSDSKYIKYKPSRQSAAFNSGAKERIIRMVEMPVDPLEPPKFKHKRIIGKFHHVFRTGRIQKGIQFHWISVLQLMEEVYRRFRLMITSQSCLRLSLAAKARSERIGTVAPAAAVSMSSDRNAMDIDSRMDYEPVRERERDILKESKEEREERLQREKIREERRRERERERRLEAKDAALGKKSKITRDRDRDISEKVALGMASTGAGRGEVMYDQRLFNQGKGMDSGFATDDQYNIYDKGLFTAQPTLSTLYKPKKDMDSDMYGGADEKLEKLMKTERFKPDKVFTGTSEKSGPRDKPLEFEREVEEADQFLTEVKKGKNAMDKVGSGGTMKASAGSSMRDGYEGGSSRSRIGFERGH